MKTLVVVNAKGGVGKTATSCTLVRYLAAQGMRVLCMDTDEQGHMSNTLRRSGKVTVSATTTDQVLVQGGGDIEAADCLLLPAGPALLDLERQPDRHNAFAGNLKRFLASVGDRFDFAIIDTNPTRDIRVVAALVCADFVLSPVQLAQESLEGVHDLLNHKRIGVERIRKLLNPQLRLLGLLPVMVEHTPVQAKAMHDLLAVSAVRKLLISLDGQPVTGENVAFIPRRSVIQDAQGKGHYLPELKRHTSARDTWREIQPVYARIAQMMGAR